MLSPFNLEEFRDPLRLETYKRLANAMGRAIENRDELLRKIEILYFDIEKLKEIIQNTGKSIISRDHRKQLGLLKAENAVYEIFLTVNRYNGTISIGGKIVTIETGTQIAFSGNYNVKAPSLIAQYPPVMKASNVNVNKVKPAGVKTKKLDISKIYYQAPGSDHPIEISNEAAVQTEGKIWFEISMKEGGGYLLAYLRDSEGRAYNLFPGTRNAITNGDYRIPFNLDNPCTDVQKTAAENAITAKLSSNKVLIGGYTFDDRPGTEYFSFYYTDERNSKLEAIIKEAQNIGKDMPRMKGVLTGTSRINLDATPGKPIFYHNELRLKFIHIK